ERAEQGHVTGAESIQSGGTGTSSAIESYPTQSSAEPNAAPSLSSPALKIPAGASTTSSSGNERDQDALTDPTAHAALLVREKQPLSQLPTAVSSAPAQTTSKINPSYSFPVCESQIDARFKAMSKTELQSELERLCYGRDPDSGQRRPYQDIRLP